MKQGKVKQNKVRARRGACDAMRETMKEERKGESKK